MADVSSSATCSPSSSIGILNSIVATLVQSLLVSQCNIISPDSYPSDFTSEALEHGLDDIDFIVVGTGSSGSVMASRLSENPDWNVLVLEAGDNPSPDSEIPSLSNALQFSEKSWDYFTEPNSRSCNAFRDNRCYIAMGKNIGGSSQIDNMAYLTGNSRDYDRWCRAGNYGWCYSDVKPYFEKSLTPQGNATHPKGFLQISPFEQYDDKYSQLLWKAVQEMGQPIVSDFTENSYLGYSFIKGFVENGRRTSPGKVYLGKVARRPNLKVMKNAQVTKLLHDCHDQKIKSVEILVGEKQTLQVKFRKEVILAAGAIETAKILMLSGIGPKTVLEPLNIMTFQNLPVGENLKDTVKVDVYIKLSPKTQGSTQFENNLFKFLSSNEGPMRSNGISAFVGFIKRQSENSEFPDIQIEHKLFQQKDKLFERYLNGLAVKDELKPSLLDAIKTNDVLVITLNLLTPCSLGCLKLKTSSFLDVPLLYTNYLKDSRDADTLIEALEYINQLCSTAEFLNENAEIIRIPLPECDITKYKSKNYWKCYLKYFAAAGNCIVGTVKMGARYDDSAVVTPRLLVKNISNLRVVDRATMPSPPSANSAAPSVMLAEKAVDFIIQDYSFDSHSHKKHVVSKNVKRTRII